MLAAISTTILSRRSCALTGSAITSRSRRNSTRGPPSAARMGVIPRALQPEPLWLQPSLNQDGAAAGAGYPPRLQPQRRIANGPPRPQGKGVLGILETP